ncbi:MAG: hypothetical protein AB7F86_04170 [Bdellovibrionales bacterium]
MAHSSTQGQCTLEAAIALTMIVGMALFLQLAFKTDSARIEKAVLSTGLK